MKRVIVLLACALICGLSVEAEPVPQTMSHQGLLRDVDGGIVDDGTYAFTFRIYTGSDSLLWEENHPSVAVEGGIFNVTLGRGEPEVPLYLPFDQTYYLGIAIGANPEMLPLIELTASPYAFRAKSAAVADSVKNPGTVGISGSGGPGRIALFLDEDTIGSSMISQVGDSLTIGDTLACRGGGPAGPRSGVLECNVDANFGGHATFGGPLEGETIIAHELELHKDPYGSGPELRIYDDQDRVSAFLHNTLLGSRLWMYNYDRTLGVQLDADARHVECWNSSGHSVAKVTAHAWDGGSVILCDDQGRDRVSMYGDRDGTNAGYLGLYDTDGDIAIDLDGYNAGYLGLYDGDGDIAIDLTANARTMQFSNVNDECVVRIEAGGSWAGGGMVLCNDQGHSRVAIYGDNQDNDYGYVGLRNAAGETTVQLKGDGGGGHGRVITDVLEITGADLAEPFDVTGTDVAKPGMVLTIDATTPGNLKISSKPYDRCVAGIISGAGGINPGVLMGQSQADGDGEHPVAMSGRVYCWADAVNGPIKPGDLLTTSATPGHAMKATNHQKAQGAIIGKAMSSLESGRDLVLVLVSLQ
ncbi:hypothetical protein ACFL6M_05670 [Candidatus Eisenbacteria bacterium]|uniref:Uncharacterized protein n=1 Tax=Eiseniibacteriota bacterium TaxID=2212470 RepID=A0ABV6YL68_UNCEI